MQAIFDRQREVYAAAAYPSLDERKQRLKTLKALLIRHRETIVAEIDADFSARSADETRFADLMPCIQNINYSLSRLRRWIKPSSRHVGPRFLPARGQAAGITSAGGR